MNTHRSRFFAASCVALVVTAMSFALRGGANQYLTALSPRELLHQKLHAAIEISRARLETTEGDQHMN